MSLRGTKQSNQYYIYVMANFENGTLYVGVTSNLIKRVYEHRNKLVDGFTKKYNVTKLVYYEVYGSIEDAIRRKKQLKAGSRLAKLDLVNGFNREWNDLYEDLLG